jgi:hypothetical protein
MADTKEEQTAPPSHGVSSPGFPEENMSVGRYLATRVTSLRPPMHKAPNPLKALMLLNKQQWLFFLVCLFTWVLCYLYGNSDWLDRSPSGAGLGMHLISFPSQFP